MLRSRMGFGALAIVIAGISITASLLPTLKASALLPSSGGGPTAEFVDIAHIAVVLSGTYNGDDLSAYSGMFFNSGTANLYQSSCNLHTGAGCGGGGNGISSLTYNYTGAKLNHPGCGTSNIKNISGGPGNWTGDLTVYLPPTGTSNACQVYTAPGTSLIDETGGFQADIVDENDQVGAQLAGAQSTSMYFMNSATTIYQASDDPTYGGTSGAAYVYTETGGSGEFKRDSMSGSACPDYIKLPAGSFGGQTSVQASYVVQTGAGGGNCKALDTFTVGVLAEKPSAVLASLNGGSTTPGGGSTTSTAAPPDTCPIQNWALRWLVCPIIDTIDAAVTPINGYLDNLLTIPTSTFDTTQEPGKAYFTAWGDFRDLAVSLIVIAALIMVIGESAGFDLLDAYSIRKILPRLLTGAIAMTLSWVLCTFLIQLFNNLNNWLPDIILTPFQGLYNNGAALTPTGVLGTIENAGGATLFAGATVVTATAAIVILGIPAILSLLLTLFLAMIVAFITLTVRTMIIVLWLITAPLGIACYILPTTQKGYNFWRDAGTSAFVAGLAVVTFIAAGQLVAIVTVAGKGPVPILAPVAIIVSYLSIGSAFRAAGGLIGTAAGAVHSAHGGALGGLKKFRRSQAGGRLHKMANGEEVYKNTNPIARRLNPIVQGIGLAPKAIAQNPNVFRRGNYNRLRSNIEAARVGAEGHEAEEIREKNPTVKAVLGDDMKVWAIMETTAQGGEFARQNIDARLTDNDAGVRQSLINHGFTGSNEELELTVSQIMAAKKAGGNGQALLQAAVVAQAATGTGYGTDLREAQYNAAGELIAGGGMATEDGAGQMMQWTDLAYGANRNGAGNAIAKMRGDAVASGRIDLGGAGFGDTMRAYDQVHRARTGQSPIGENGTPTGGPALTAAQAAMVANETIYESAMDGNDANKVADGKPRSAQAMARQSAQKMQRLLARVDQAQAGVTAGTMTADQLRDAQRLADQHLGSVMSLYDTIGHKSPQNQRAFANGLNSVGVLDATNFRGGMVPTRGVSILQLGDLRTNDVEGGATGAGTVGGPRANHDYRETRRDYNAGAAPPGTGPPPT